MKSSRTEREMEIKQSNRRNSYHDSAGCLRLDMKSEKLGEGEIPENSFYMKFLPTSLL